MKKIEYKGQNGVFFTNEEFVKLQEKVLAQRELINDLEKEMMK